jgi:hypothetical protein
MNYNVTLVRYGVPSNTPMFVQEFWPMMGLRAFPTYLGMPFCHEMRASTGQRFLVIFLDLRYEDDSHMSYYIFKPGNLFHDPVLAREINENHPTDIIQMSSPAFAELAKGFIAEPPPPGEYVAPGKIDPKYPSHLIIRDFHSFLDFRLCEVDSKGILHTKWAAHALIP